MLPPAAHDHAQPSALPLIAILVPISACNISDASTDTLPLFSVMLPSLMMSLDCGYQYLVVVGFDEYDDFYSTAKVS